MELKDYLEEQMDLQKRVTIRFRSVDGGLSEVQAHVVKISETAGREMIETDAGLLIGMDQVVDVDGRSASNYC
jgi:hypothetical protein